MRKKRWSVCMWFLLLYRYFLYLRIYQCCVDNEAKICDECIYLFSLHTWCTRKKSWRRKWIRASKRMASFPHIMEDGRRNQILTSVLLREIFGDSLTYRRKWEIDCINLKRSVIRAWFMTMVKRWVYLKKYLYIFVFYTWWVLLDAECYCRHKL